MLIDKFYKYVGQTSTDPAGIEISKAEGMYLYDIQNKKYIDLVAGISVCNMGHSHPDIVAATKAQIDKYMHVMCYGELVQEPQVELATLLCEQLPSSLNSVFFVNSGSEAVEGGLKLAKKVTGREELIHFDHSYHGATNGSLSVIGNEEYRESFKPLLPKVKEIRFGMIEDLAQITEATAGIIVELIQGEGGIRIAPQSYWQALRKRCNETGTMLIVDEIQTGLGRTGKLFAFEHYDIVPDILLLAKAFGGGMPLGAFIASKDMMMELTHHPALGHITTFGGHPVCCAAGLAHLKLILKNEMWKYPQKYENQLVEVFSHLRGVEEIRHFGFMMALDFHDSDVCLNMLKTFFANGLFSDWFLFCNSALRVAPPLILKETHIDEIEKIIKRI